MKLNTFSICAGGLKIGDKIKVRGGQFRTKPAKWRTILNIYRYGGGMVVIETTMNFVRTTQESTTIEIKRLS